MQVIEFSLTLSKWHKGRTFNSISCIDCFLLLMGGLVLPHCFEHCAQANVFCITFCNGCRDGFGVTGFLEREKKRDSVHTCTMIT